MARGPFEFVPAGARALETDDGPAVVSGPVNPSLRVLTRLAPPFAPRGFQREVVSGLVSHGGGAGLLAVPTGGGKTAIAAMVCLARMNRAPASRTVWVAPQRELLQQAALAFERAWWGGSGPARVIVRIAERSADLEAEADVLLLSCALLLRAKGRLSTQTIAASVFDEAHHAAASEFGQAWQQLKGACLAHHDGLVLGLSATPRRTVASEQRALLDAFDRNLFLPASLGEHPMETLVSLGILARTTLDRIPTGFPDAMRWRGPEDPRSIQSFALDGARWAALVGHLLRTPERRTLVFSHNREHGLFLTRHLRHGGLRAEYVDGETPDRVRQGALERFAAGKTKALVSVRLMLEGIDVPGAEAVCLTYPVTEAGRLQQIVGRALRGPASGGVDVATVVSPDLSDVSFDDLMRTRYHYGGWLRRPMVEVGPLPEAT